MNEIKNTKVVVLVPPQLKNNGAVTGNTYVDTAGWGHARFLACIGTTDVIVGSTDTAHPLKIEECDTYNGSYTDVDDAAMAAVIAANGDDKVHAIDVDLTKQHKRYMEFNAPTAGNSTGANICCLVILSKPEGNAPASAAEQGLAELVEV